MSYYTSHTYLINGRYCLTAWQTGTLIKVVVSGGFLIPEGGRGMTPRVRVVFRVPVGGSSSHNGHVSCL